MSFGRRGVIHGAQSTDQAGFGRAGQSRSPDRFTALGGEEFILRYSRMEAVLGALGMAVCWYFLKPAMSGGDMTGKTMFVSAMIALMFIGCAFLFLAGLSGKLKLKIDANGLTQGTLMGASHLAWRDISGFEILSVNYNKSVFAIAKSSSMLSMARRVRIPVGAFKSRNYEVLKWTTAYRPDLAPHILAVMSKVGAKRLVKELASEHGATAG